MKKILIAKLLFVYGGIFAQKTDTLFITFSENMIDKYVFINKIDAYGNIEVDEKTEQLNFCLLIQSYWKG